MNEAPSKTPDKYTVMRADGTSAPEVFRVARSDGYKTIDCAFIVAGLFGLDFREARKMGRAIAPQPGDGTP